jgi:hypothetical protein
VCGAGCGWRVVSRARAAAAAERVVSHPWPRPQEPLLQQSSAAPAAVCQPLTPHAVLLAAQVRPCAPSSTPPPPPPPHPPHPPPPTHTHAHAHAHTHAPHLDALKLALDLCDGQHVRHDLTGVVVVREAVDHRHLRASCVCVCVWEGKQRAGVSARTLPAAVARARCGGRAPAVSTRSSVTHTRRRRTPNHHTSHALTRAHTRSHALTRAHTRSHALTRAHTRSHTLTRAHTRHTSHL